MPGGEVIDLLSSDEDAAPTFPIQTTLKPAIAQAAPPPTTNFYYLSDDFDSTVHLDDSYNAQPKKRQKLSRASRPLPKVAPPSKATANEMTVESPRRSAHWTNDGFSILDDSDPTDSISAHRTAKTAAWKLKETEELNRESEDSDDSLPEDIFAPSRQFSKVRRESSDRTTALVFDNEDFQGIPAPSDSIRKPSQLSEKTKALLASISNKSGIGNKSSRIPPPLMKATANGTPQSSTLRTCSSTDNSEEEETSQRKPIRQTKKPRLTEEERAQKAEGKVQRAEAKVREKEAKTREKEQAREEKAREKEEKVRRKKKDAELAHVNKAKLDKKDSTPEMIVDLPASIHGQRVDSQTREFLKNLDVETSLYQSAIPNVVKWRRKVKAIWSTEAGLWEPLPQMQIEDEKHVLCIIPAEQFASLANSHGDNEYIDSHVTKLKSAYPDCIPIYLIEGLSKKIRESKNAANRKYQNEVLSQIQPAGQSSSQANKRKKPASIIIDEDIIEAALLRLQVIHHCLIHHTAIYIETAEWIAVFTQHISTIPYRRTHDLIQSSTHHFCMDPGQIKAGANTLDTYNKMLQEVIRVTPAIATAITDAYPTVTRLVRAFREEGPFVLQDLHKAASRNGAVSERKLGRAVSRRLWAVFRGEGDGSANMV